jgi:hypothetical protein
MQNNMSSFKYIYKNGEYLGKLCLEVGENQWKGDDVAIKEVNNHRLLNGNQYNGFYETMRDGGLHGVFESKKYKYNNDNPKVWKPKIGECVIFFNKKNGEIENKIGYFFKYEKDYFYDFFGNCFDSVSVLHIVPSFMKKNWIRDFFVLKNYEDNKLEIKKELYDNLQELLMVKDYQTYDFLMKEIENNYITKIDILYIVAFLRLSYIYKEYLKNWIDFLNVSKKEIEFRGLNSNTILTGLLE